MRRRALGVIVCVSVVAAPALPAGHFGNWREGRRSAGRRVAGCRNHRDQRRHGRLPGSGLESRRQLFHFPDRARPLPDQRQARGLPRRRTPRYSRRGRQDAERRHPPRSRRGRGNRHRHGRLAARRRHLGRNRRAHLRPGAHRPAGRQPQLHGVCRQRARRAVRADHRLPERHDARQRAAGGRQQRHLRRRGQRGRPPRDERRRPGAHGQRSDPGGPGPHKSVRRRVRSCVGRGDQRGHQVGHEQFLWLRLRLLHRQERDGGGLLCETERRAQA